MESCGKLTFIDFFSIKALLPLALCCFYEALKRIFVGIYKALDYESMHMREVFSVLDYVSGIVK